MNIVSFELLRSYYFLDPQKFMEILRGDSVTSKIYRALLEDVLADINTQFRSISNATIAQIDLNGNVLMINNDVQFFNTKKEIKEIPCSVEKVGSETILIADGPNKRAMVLSLSVKNFVESVKVNYVGETENISTINEDFFQTVFGNVNVSVAISTMSWQYQSSRYITSFQLIPVDYQEISIDDDGIRNSSVWIRQGTTVKWLNNSSKPISIYSGKTYYDQFTLDPNLALYGKEFKSPVIQPGKSWSYKFVSVGESDWFIYPDILTGTVTVTRERLNPNDQFLIVEDDNLGKPFSSRVIKVDSWGNVMWSFGEAYLVNPRKAQPLLNGGIVISA